MPRSSSSLAEDFSGHLESLEWTRAKMERLLASGGVVRRDVEQVYAGLYLEAITSFEHLIEDLFIGLLVGGLVSDSAEVVPRVSFRSYRVARDVVLAGEKYVDWFPYDRTQKRARAFFRRGLPFTRLDGASERQVRRLLHVRNAIAHKSAHSRRMLEEKVIGSLPLTPRERRPAGFLRSIYRSAPAQTRYQELASQMASLAITLCR